MARARIGAFALVVLVAVPAWQGAFAQPTQETANQQPTLPKLSQQLTTSRGQQVSPSRSQQSLPENAALNDCKIVHVIVSDFVNKDDKACKVAEYVSYYVWNTSPDKKVLVTVALKANADFRKSLLKELKNEANRDNSLTSKSYSDSLKINNTYSHTLMPGKGQPPTVGAAAGPDLKQEDIAIHLAPGEWQPVGSDSSDWSATPGACAPAEANKGKSETVKKYEKYVVVGATYENTRSEDGSQTPPTQPAKP